MKVFIGEARVFGLIVFMAFAASTALAQQSKEEYPETEETTQPTTPPLGKVEQKIADISQRVAFYVQQAEEWKERARRAKCSVSKKCNPPVTQQPQEPVEQTTTDSQNGATQPFAGNMRSRIVNSLVTNQSGNIRRKTQSVNKQARVINNNSSNNRTQITVKRIGNIVNSFLRN